MESSGGFQPTVRFSLLGENRRDAGAAYADVGVRLAARAAGLDGAALTRMEVEVALWPGEGPGRYERDLSRNRTGRNCGFRDARNWIGLNCRMNWTVGCTSNSSEREFWDD